MSASRARPTAAPLARPLAVAVWTLAIGIPVGIGALVVASPLPEQDAWAIPLYSLIVATWGVVGAFLVTRLPGNRVGWVLLAVGLGIGASMVATLWAGLSLAVHDGTLPGTTAATVLSVVFYPSLYLVMLVPLLFPDGRVMSWRWGAVGVLLLTSAAMTFAGSLLLPGEMEGIPGVENPIGVPALGEVAGLLLGLGGIGSFLCLPAGIAAVILRYRRGTVVERKQLTWFGSVLVLAFTAFLGATTLPQPIGQWAWIVASISMGLIPVAIGIAVLRYRLYEIDRIISRTIGWALTSGLVVAVFAGTIVGLQTLLSPFTNNNTLAVAGSTLVAAALFQPLRARVQRAVDRRFNRSRVDAQHALDAFGAHLRDEVDLAFVHGRLLEAADRAVQPAGADLWLRGTRS